MHEDGIESTLIEAPALRQSNSKGKDRSSIALRDLPVESLPSTIELPRDYESQQAVPSSIAGFQPDMDPHLRQVLEALEDDAFVDDGLEDDFFTELVEEGEAGPDERAQYDFSEEGFGDEEAWLDGGQEGEGELGDNAGWEARFAAYKKKQQREALKASAAEDDGGNGSEGADTVGRMPEFSVIGGKKRRKGGSDASEYSMTSSSIFRTDGLRLLDDRFEQVRYLLLASICLTPCSLRRNMTRPTKTFPTTRILKRCRTLSLAVRTLKLLWTTSWTTTRLTVGR
jgi:protein LTV1